MAHSLLSNLRACGLALAISFAAGAQNDEPEELVLTSGPITFNGQTNLFEAHAARITQGNLSIEADEVLATAIDFNEQSEWRFKGNVRITIDTAVIEAASAVFTFEQKRLSRGELEGEPVTFTDTDPTRQINISGYAQKMSYDYVARTLRMVENARMQKDNVEMRGCDLIYDFAAERVTSGSADCADLFRVRVLPKDQPPSPDSPQ
jgi:lipopolysaccharide transport protein LptA